MSMKESSSSTTASSSSCRIDPFPPQHRPDPPPAGGRPLPSDLFIRNFNNFKSSGTPSRFFYFENRTWVDVAHQVFDELSAAFVAGKTIVEVSIDGTICLFDFIRMIRIDLSTRDENLIGWVDVNGRRFFPDSSDESDRPKFPGAEVLGDDDKFYKVVERLFLNGMRRIVPGVTVTSVRRCLYSGFSGASRVRAFRMMMDMTKAARGDANVRFGWFGAATEVVAGVAKHGFGRSNEGALGDEAHGVGVHLSPPNFPHGSSLLSEADEAGEKHMILCRIIMGNSERVEAGSSQRHPSSDEFDSGISGQTNPEWYIVWSTHMNTHILPEYIVSFRSSNRSQGHRTSVSSAQRTFVAPGLSFQKLLAEIGRSLPSSSMQSLELLYSKQKAGKISKDAFIKYLRSVAGDKLLASTIKRIRGY